MFQTRWVYAVNAMTREVDDDAHTDAGIRLKGFRPTTTRPHVFELESGPGAGQKFVLDHDDLTIGRNEHAGLVLESDEVSRIHARVTRIDGEYTIEDLQSRNGLFLNGLRIHAAVVRDGDQLQVGDVLLSYREGT
jgi:pSer/pThr/pTyr-binding forkhead associated (FHA) protein